MKDASTRSIRLQARGSGTLSASSGLNGITIPWGPSGSLDLGIPAAGLLEGRVVDVAWAELNSSLVDYRSELEHALDSPLGMPRIEQQVKPGSRVALIVDDPSRWTPVGDALPPILQRLHAAGVRREDVTISIGVGRHHAVDPDAMRQRVGTTIAAQYRCESPPVDDRSAYLDLGQTHEGIPVLVFRPVAEADLRILVGSVLPHLQAGFGGGYKLIFPGTSHRSTLVALHRQGLGPGSKASGLIGGDAAHNPMRQAIHTAAELLGPCWSVSHLAGGANQVFRILAGHPIPVQDALAAEARQRFQVPLATLADVVVAGNHPWPGDPMQSFKVLLHHRAACLPDGVLAGFFWTDPEEIDRSFPMALLRLIASSGIVGAATIQTLLPLAERLATVSGKPAAFMLRWARELVVDRSIMVYAPPLYDRLGPRLGPVRLFADQAALWAAVESALRRTNAHRDAVQVRVFPQGGLTYVADRPASTQ